MLRLTIEKNEEAKLRSFIGVIDPSILIPSVGLLVRPNNDWLLDVAKTWRVDVFLEDDDFYRDGLVPVVTRGLVGSRRLIHISPMYVKISPQGVPYVAGQELAIKIGEFTKTNFSFYEIVNGKPAHHWQYLNQLNLEVDRANDEQKEENMPKMLPKNAAPQALRKPAIAGSKIPQTNKTISKQDIINTTHTIMEGILSSNKNLQGFTKKLIGSTLTDFQVRIIDSVQGDVKKLNEDYEAKYQKLAEESLEKLTKIEANSRHTITIKERDKPDKVAEGIFHYKTPLLLQLVQAGNTQALIGATQSSKSYVAKVIADMMDIPFTYHAFGPTQTEARLVGYTGATGVYTPTELYFAFKYGQLILMDEVDTANPTVLIQLNNLISNKIASFPRGMVEQLREIDEGEAVEFEKSIKKYETGGIVEAHENFRMVWSANTWGKGATMSYVGRNALDASTLARLDKVFWDYDDGIDRGPDEADVQAMSELLGEYHKGRSVGSGGMEMKMTLAKYPSQTKWVNFVQRVRKAVDDAGLDFPVTPSHSLRGANNLDFGIDPEDVLEVSLFAGIDTHSKFKILENL